MIYLLILKKSAISFLLCVASFTGVSQTGVGAPGSYYQTEFSVTDCFKNAFYNGKFVSDSVAATRVMKGQQIWRTIALDNEKNKTVLNTNVTCADVGIFEIIKFGLFEKKLNAFSTDNFTDVKGQRLSADQLRKQLTYTDTSVTIVFDANGAEQVVKNNTRRYLMGSDIKSYLLKEDWIINSYSGKVERHIIALAPLVYDQKSEKALPLFWLYYAEWKELFSAFKTKSSFTGDVVSFDAVFTQRQFISQISKENNLTDRSIKSVNHANDAALESEIIKEKLMKMENDLFQY